VTVNELPPDEHTASLINDTLGDIRAVATLPDGRPRDVSLDQLIAVNEVRSRLAVASALLAVAAAIKDRAA
jgi:hypothetical protein